MSEASKNRQDMVAKAKWQRGGYKVLGYFSNIKRHLSGLDVNVGRRKYSQDSKGVIRCVG